MRYFSLLLAVVAFIGANAQRFTRQNYVDTYKDWAITEMNRVGIPASITLAQGILESDCGNSRLATEGNNHFGIKCHSDWKGETIFHDDDKLQECFRKYTSAYESFKDHSNFIKEKSRYASLFYLDHRDYAAWAKGLRSAGYATDPTYAQKLITIIEEMGLYVYDGSTQQDIAIVTDVTPDKEPDILPVDEPAVRVRTDLDFVINPMHQHEVQRNNGVKYIEVQNGDSFEAIALEFHLYLREILVYNDLDASADIKTLKYLYIRSKKNRAHYSCVTHTVEAGDTPWSVAHQYGIKLRKLLRFNHISATDELQAGQILNLRRSK